MQVVFYFNERIFKISGDKKKINRRRKLKFILLIGDISWNFEISYCIQLHEFLLFLVT